MYSLSLFSIKTDLIVPICGIHIVGRYRILGDNSSEVFENQLGFGLWIHCSIMPSYELAMLTRSLSKPDMVSILKRTANAIFDCGGIIRSIENLGKRAMPYKTSSHGAVHREANYFVLMFDAPPSKLEDLKRDYNRDVDIIRSRIFKVQPQDTNHECNIQEEMKPAPYRSEVIKLIEEIKRKEEKQTKFKYNTGFDYYPFQK
ncbi:unnamed protein product [Nezara viridula]|uniref:Small ribosomal subunit protein bS6m n=1 Tax=Nezara viridula TaxID=85310 RepID=A0A9P0MUL8_NEZVI|nr:unnamed protein product [Nezara viridula]